MSTPFSESSFGPSTLVEILRWRALQQPDRLAYTFLEDGETEEAHLTYGDLDRQARAIGALLQGLGTYGERALLLYPPGLEFIAGFFGCLYAGMVGVPANPPLTAKAMERIDVVVRDADASAALTTAAVRSRLLGRRDRGSPLDALPCIATDAFEPATGATWCPP